MSLTLTGGSVAHNTFVIERTYPAAPDRVFAAFADPAKKRRWFGEGGSHDVNEFAMEFRVGGAEHYGSVIQAGPVKGAKLTNDGVYQDIVPNERLVIASTMALDGRRISSSLTTFEFTPSGGGTLMIFTHQGAFFEGSDGSEIRQDGWRHLFDRLASELAAS